MAFYCTTMLAIALELAREEPEYGDIASKFFEHFVAIANAMNHLGGAGMWHEDDGFYYDQMITQAGPQPMRIRSMVGVIPLFAAECLEDAHLEQLPTFRDRMRWFLANKPGLGDDVSFMPRLGANRLLAIPTRARLACVLRYVLDEGELLSRYGVRSLSKAHARDPYVMQVDGERREVRYTPGESDSGLFGGNSNWRGPIWFPVNYLLAEALKRYHRFYGESFTIECPTGSGVFLNLHEVAEELERRLVRLFLPDGAGARPCHGARAMYAQDPHFKDLVLFHEYFHGASHQTGWTALASNLLELVAQGRAARGE